MDSFGRERGKEGGEEERREGLNPLLAHVIVEKVLGGILPQCRGN